MCNNIYLQEKYIEEQRNKREREMRRQRLVSGYRQPGMIRHLVSGLGRQLVMLGTWLEHVERSEVAPHYK